MWCPEKLKHNQTWHYTHWQWFFKKILHLTSWTSSSTSCACWEFCASLMNNSTTFSILKLGTIFHWCLVRSWPLAGTACKFLVCLFTFLSMQHKVNQLRVRTSGRTGSELPSWLLGEEVEVGGVRVFCGVFCDMMPNCEMLSFLNATEQQETSNAVGKLCRQ